MQSIPYIPETAPFTAEQRAWLNGFLAGLLANSGQNERSVAPSNGGEPLLILFGSQTGTAEGLAKQAAGEARRRGFAPRVLPLNDFKDAALIQASRALIISSTWGDGEPPDNAASFWAWLNSEGAPRLENLEFAVLGLGDKNYADFCGASKKFDVRLQALGARRILPRAECDTDYEASAKNWLDDLWKNLHPTNGSVLPANGHAIEDKTVISKSNPFPARLLKNFRLSQEGSAKEVWHHEISLEGSGLTYEAGDALGVMPVNSPALVDELTAVLQDVTDDLREAFRRKFDIIKPSRGLLEAVAQRAPTCELAGLLAAERASDLKAWLWGHDIIDVLRFLREPLPVADFVPLLKNLAPRLYSISSSPKAHPGEAHLTVASVRYQSHGRARNGVASTFLVRAEGPVKVFVQPSPSFKPPDSRDVPIIMVGPGTGIAPFRAFLEERQATGAKGKNWLFFGDQKRAADFLYEEQLTTWVKHGFLARLDLAFSRDQAEKIYVQHRMLENASELWSWLEDGAHFYVCGDAARMASDVDAALHRIIETAGGKSADEARSYVAKLRSDRRYQRDIY